MIEITHRHINGTEVSFDDLPHYKITNRTILDIVLDVARRNGNRQAITEETSKNISH